MVFKEKCIETISYWLLLKKEALTVQTLKFVYLAFHVCEILWEQWFGRKHEWLLSEHRSVCVCKRVCLCACMCVISSWAAGCRQPGRDKRGWMEGALHECVSSVWVWVHLYIRVGKSLHKGLEVCVPLSASAGLRGDKQTAKYSPCVFPAKTGGGIPTTQTDATGSGLEWVVFPGLRSCI